MTTTTEAHWPPFRRMLEVQAAHAAGDALVAIALAGTLFFAVPADDARDRVALYLLLTMTPFALLGPVVGPMLDRWRDSYRIAIAIAAGGRAFVALAMASRTSDLAVYPLAFALLVLSRAHGVSRSALVPAVLPPDRSLMWANGRLAAVSFVGGVAAIPGIAVQKLLGSGATLGLAGVVFAVAAVAASGLPRSTDGPRARGVVPRAHRALAPHLLASGAGAAALRCAVGYLVFFLAFALRARGHGGGAFTLVLVAAGAGGLAGSLIAPALRRLVRGALVLLGALVVLGATAFVAAPSFGLGTAAFVAAVAAFCASAGRLGFDSLIQRDAPEEVRGRAFARYETVFQLAWVGGAGLATAIPVGAGTGLRILAVICLVGLLLAVRGAVRGQGTGVAAPKP